jgi:hypothetical protein
VNILLYSLSQFSDDDQEKERTMIRNKNELTTVKSVLTLGRFFRCSFRNILLNLFRFLNRFSGLQICWLCNFLLLSFDFFRRFSRTKNVKLERFCFLCRSFSFSHLIASCRCALRNSGCWLRLARICSQVTPVIAR